MITQTTSKKQLAEEWHYETPAAQRHDNSSIQAYLEFSMISELFKVLKQS